MRVRPKVIASSATVRRADSQVHSLFLRGVHVFPPSGLDAGDSFFARQRPPTEQLPGRRYLGVYAPGIRHKVATMGTYIAFMAAAKKLFDEHGVAGRPLDDDGGLLQLAARAGLRCAARWRTR